MYSFDYEFRASAKHRYCLMRATSVPLLKLFNVAEPPRMAVVPRRNEICEMQISQVKMCKDVHFDRACGCFLYAPSIYAVSLQKRWKRRIYCVVRRLLQKRWRCVHLLRAAQKINAQGIRTDRDVRGSTQKCDVLNRAICAI